MCLLIIAGIGKNYFVVKDSVNVPVCKRMIKLPI